MKINRPFYGLAFFDQVIKPDYRNAHYRAIEDYFKKQVETQIGVKENDMVEL